MTTELRSIEQSSRLIARAAVDWLQEEVEISATDRNASLDDYENAQDWIKMAYEDPDNISALKNESHLTRLPIWWEAFLEDPTDDWQSAQLAFAGLMFISGMYRNQCYLEARNLDDYLEKRKKGIAIDAERPVIERLALWLPPSGNFSEASINIQELDKTRVQAACLGELAVRNFLDWGHAGKQHYMRDIPERSSREMRAAQHNWLVYVTDNLVLHAKNRGGRLEAVPFLEPRSITDQPQDKKVDYRIARLIAL